MKEYLVISTQTDLLRLTGENIMYVSADGGANEYTVDHQNHPGLFNKDGYISFCGHGTGIKFRNIRIKDLSKSKGKRR